MPEKLTALSGNEWTHVQIEQLKVVFQDVPDVSTFFDGVGLKTFQTSVRGIELLSVLNKVDEALFRKYTQSQEDVEGMSLNETDIRANKMLQHPICKALFAAKTFISTESFVDDFVKHLLHEMGFNAGMLYVAPQMRNKLTFGAVEKMAIADFTIIDLLTNAKIVVIEDKYWEKIQMITDSTPQLLANIIAVAQRNNEALVGVKRDSMGISKSRASASCQANLRTVYGIRVSGSVFRFYRIHVGDAILGALENQTFATTDTTMFCYKLEKGLDFMVKKEREKIILILSLLQEVALFTGELSPPQSSEDGLQNAKREG
mmetsp:Transcript_2299/g.3543  ORF Transcript_2299/g.3543 Transcript_2299/m.3543 type:complete len:317 (+) Transcript_2299:362-1312(+)